MALTPIHLAQARISSTIKPLAHEVVPLEEAVGRVATLTTNAARALPPWDCSAMDGYAVPSATVGPGARLRVSQRIFAGERPAPLEPTTCARIMTGAPLPLGADAVVMQEHVTAEADEIVFSSPVPAGLNVRRAGEDVSRGQPVLSAGSELGIAQAGLLWAQGLTHLSVHKRPVVAIASSGDELSDLGSTDESRIIDSNTPVIAALVRRAGGIPLLLGRAADSLQAQRTLFERGLSADVLITLAGASVGERDFTKDALVSSGVAVEVWKVAMRPGKPLLFGVKGACRVFGLPGNPVSAMVTFEVFVRPVLLALQGLSSQPEQTRARAAVSLQGHPELTVFVRATTSFSEGQRWAHPISSQSSGALSSAANATTLIELPAGTSTVAQGQEVALFPVTWGPAK